MIKEAIHTAILLFNQIVDVPLIRYVKIKSDISCYFLTRKVQVFIWSVHMTSGAITE